VWKDLLNALLAMELRKYYWNYPYYIYSFFQLLMRAAGPLGCTDLSCRLGGTLVF
jgi:hypothetical protein